MLTTMTTEKARAGHNRWDAIRRSTAEQVEEQRRWARAVLDGASLAELRALVGLTQDQVAASVGVSQVEAGRAERRADLQISTLRRYLDALGCDLEILARPRAHPERAVPLTFGDVKRPVPTRRGRARPAD